MAEIDKGYRNEGFKRRRVKYLGVILEEGPINVGDKGTQLKTCDTELAGSGLKREGVSTLLFSYQSSTSRSGLRKERAIITKLTQQDCPTIG